MARNTRHQWFSWRNFTSQRREAQRPCGTRPLQRRLRVEPLEERRLLAVVTVDTLDDTVDFNDGMTSLREAIFATNLVGGTDTIEFAASLTSGGPAALLLMQGELAITDALVINGPSANLLTIDASGNDSTRDENNGDGSRIFIIDDGNFSAQVDVSISGLSFTGADASSIKNGGAIFNDENLTITASTISGNSTRGGGGGIYSGLGGDLIVTDSAISDNSAYGLGGGISSFLGSLTITNSTISGNSSVYGGGGVSSHSGNLTVTLSMISGNSTPNSGGGIAFRGVDKTMSVTGSFITGNSARYGNGGGLSSEYGNLTLTGSSLSGNSAGGTYGGGIFSRSGRVTMVNTNLSGNSATRYGGGIHGDNITITDSTISDNSALGGLFSRGGGISGSIVSVAGSTISGNQAGGSGGGIGGSYVTVSSSTISGNSAGGFNYYNGGGGVFGHITLTITGSTITGNSAHNGGGLECRYGVLTVTNSTITGDSRQLGG